MKKIASILVLVLAVTFSTQAQKKRGEKQPQKPKFTVEQQTILAVKNMALKLDLTDKQQEQIKPLLAVKITERKAKMEKRKASKTDKKKPTSDEIFEMKLKKLDNMISMKRQMKNILNKEQFEKFEKMKKGKERKRMAHNKMKGKKGEMKGKKDGMKKRKMRKQNTPEDNK